MFEFWASLEANFTRKTYTLEAETSSSAKLSAMFLLGLTKKINVFWMIFFYKKNSKLLA